MPIYDVPVSEVHISIRRIVADSAEEAKSMVADGEGEEIYMEYSRTLDPDEWGDVEEFVPSTEEILVDLQQFLDSTVKFGDWETFWEIFGEDAVYDELILEGLPEERLREIYERYTEDR